MYLSHFILNNKLQNSVYGYGGIFIIIIFSVCVKKIYNFHPQKDCGGKFEYFS